MYIFICEWNVFLLKLLEDSSFSWSVMFSEVWSSRPFSNKAHVHCLDLILQIFSTDTSYLVLKDTSRIPFTFQQTSGCFCFIRRPLAFSNSSNKHDLFRLAPKQTRRPVKTPGEKMWWKKSENCQTVNCTTCLLLKP